VTGGAVDAFIWFPRPTGGMEPPEGETQDGTYSPPRTTK